jgi:hypothetical protein
MQPSGYASPAACPGRRSSSTRTTSEWGVREMNVRDPDGHRLRFSTETGQPSDGVPFPGG